MKLEEVKEVAKEAELYLDGVNQSMPLYVMKTEDLQRCADIIEKRTIERCEAACNSLIKQQRRHEAAYGIGYLVYDAEDCAAAVRKLGE
jgi:hypothetical protein